MGIEAPLQASDFQSSIGTSIRHRYLGGSLSRLAKGDPHLGPSGRDGIDSEYFRRIHDSLSPEHQSLFRQGLCGLIAEWEPDQRTMYETVEVVSLAAYIRLTEGIDPIAHLVEAKLADKTDEPSDHACSIAVATIAGLTYTEESKLAIETTLKRFADNPKLQRYFAQILAGLVRANPNNFSEFVPRYLEIATRLGELRAASNVVAEVISEMGLETTAEKVQSLPENDLALFLRLAMQDEYEILEVIPDQCAFSDRESGEIFPCSASSSEAEQKLRQAFASLQDPPVVLAHWHTEVQ